MIRRLATLAACAACAGALPFAAPAAAAPLLITGGKVITNTGAPLEGGDVLINDGRVQAVGRNLAAPAGAVRIDATGKWVTPGLFAVISRVGMAEVGLDASGDIGVSGDKPLSAALDAAPAFNPAAAAVAVSRAGGVTRAAIVPDSEGLFAGRGAIVTLGGAEQSVLKPRAFMLLYAGERGAGAANGSRTAFWPLLEGALDDALGYPARYRGGSNGAVLGELDAQALQPFAQGAAPILIAADRAADLRQVLALKQRRPALKLAIVGGAEAWRLAGELAAARLPVVVDPMLALPGRFEQLGARLDNAALLEAAGVPVVIGLMPGGDEAFQARLVTQYAGNAVANGLAWDAAFAAISSRAAALLGFSDAGVLRSGARADVAIWDGDPLEVTSAAERVFIDGAEVELRTRQDELFARYRTIVAPAGGGGAQPRD